MLGRTLLMVLLALTFRSTWESCTWRNFITALEGEPFYLKYCPFSSHTNETTTIKWYKSNFPEDIALSSNSSPRIVPRGYVLEFWPVELDDNGNYSVHTGYSKYKWQLKVIGRNKSSCFTEKIVKSKAVEVNKRLEVNCEPGYYKNLANRTVVYKEKNQKDITVMEVLKTYGEVVWKDLGKEEATYDFLETFDCMKIKDGEDPHIKKNANFTDQGYYTCVFSVDHNGKLFNVSKTFNITIIGGHSLISPALHGPNPEYVKVELGEEVRLNCSASLNEDDSIYWINRDNDTREEPPSKIQDKEGKWQASTILIIENINDKNLNVSYNCAVVSTGSTDTKMFILLKKELVDIPGHVFTGGMIAAVLASVAVVCLVIVGVIYRVDLVLFCRHFMRKDETLTDGKTYDAFVSYLKECQPENGEEHTFAVEILPRVLEKHFGYKLCIFERDVLPGRAVVDEVHSLIEKSRRLIIVLSKSYMSNKVRYELESGLHEALVERKIKIILIKFATVSDFTFLPESLKLLKSHRVLKWKADQSLSYNSRFWKNLLYLMPAKEVKACKDESEFLPVLSQS